MSVSRETVAETVARFPVPDRPATTEAICQLLEALAAEPDPPTTVREPRQALDVHVADSLAGLDLPEIREEARNIADIGAGAGFPGLVLAAALPHARVDLIEATRRKCEVIDRLAAAAGIEARARAIPARAEEWAAREGNSAYDVVTARALAPLAVICEYAAPLLRLNGTLVAWKGAVDPDERTRGDSAAAKLGLKRTQTVATKPYSGSRNHYLYVYSKLSPTPENYPRRPGMAAKKPLG
jgi:16S rRNA (guanine527-N7)-methyltransferase